MSSFISFSVGPDEFFLSVLLGVESGMVQRKLRADGKEKEKVAKRGTRSCLFR